MGRRRPPGGPRGARVTLQEFRVDVPDAVLDDLRQRIERTRWPDLPDVGWQRGVPVAYLREVADHWAHRYDWRTWQTRLNEHPQLLTTLAGQPIHALHVRSPEPDALPLVVTHGWPGSVVEMLDVVGPLADPHRHGGDPADAFHVVVPSLPGFGFSTPLRETGWGHARIWRDGTGYPAIQATRPHTLAPALTDSPVGLLAWMLEKFWDW